MNRNELIQAIKDANIKTERAPHLLKTEVLKQVWDEHQAKKEQPIPTEEEDKHNCTVKALTVAFDIPYNEAYAFARDHFNRKQNKGVRTIEILPTFESGEVLGKKTTPVATKHEYKAIGEGTITRKMTLKVFARVNNEGTFYVLVRNHALVIKDGVIMNSTSENTRLLNAFKVA